MTIYKSRQVNLDPYPWHEVAAPGFRRPHDSEENTLEYAPRPEFEPTRDPEPWMCHDLPNHGPFETRTCNRCYWAPRRERFDTPVNRVLVAFRRVGDADPEAWSYCLSLAYTGESWPVIDHWDALEDAVEQIGNDGMDEIDHARRVLTRLANLKEAS